jgi:exocyst complex component 3
MDEIEKDLQILPGLVTSLEDLREETSRHSQLATAQENLKHLFTVPETVRQAEAAITEGKLLEAHKVLTTNIDTYHQTVFK